MTTSAPRRTLKERFPGLGRLEATPSEIRFVQQLTTADCGAAALTMTLAHHGRHVPLDDVRKVLGVSRDGASALAILDGASAFGLRGRAVSIDVDALSFIDRGSILHWEFRHWVVFERLDGDAVSIVDPAIGRRALSMRDFRRSFTGVALLLEPGDEFEKNARPSGRGVARYLERVLRHSKLLTRVVVSSLFLRLLGLALPILTGLVVDRVVPRSDYGLFEVLVVGLVGVVVFHGLSSLLRAYLNLHLRTQIDAEMTLDFIDHLVGLPYAYFQLRSPGDLMVRMSSNARVREIVTTGVLSALLDGGLATAYLVLLVIGSPLLGCMVLGLGVVRVALLGVVARKQRELQSRSLDAQGRLTGQQMEILAGMETLKGMGAEQRAAEQYSNAYVESLNVGLEQGRLAAKLEGAMSTFDVLSPLLVLCAGAFLVMKGSFSLGTMLALGALASAFLAPMSNLIQSLTALPQLSSFVERINEVLDTPRDQTDVEVRPAPRLQGGVRLEAVSFRYGKDLPMVVSDITVEIRAGEHVAIVGRSGSGKTTLGRLLAGLYRPAAGKIFFDGVDLESLEYRSVRRQLGVVTQRPFLFGGSLRKNIAYGQDDVVFDEVVAAAELAAIHEDIMAMPMAYETLATNDGSGLSGGQKQRIALARALVRRPPILVLDEATSALDAVTERQVHENLAALRCTRIVIAHRLSTVRDADRILVMDRGRVVESGTHAELMGRNAMYAELVAAQLGA
jgi:ATP-binding cassette, subfamily B, bacterial